MESGIKRLKECIDCCHKLKNVAYRYQLHMEWECLSHQMMTYQLLQRQLLVRLYKQQINLSNTAYYFTCSTLLGKASMRLCRPIRSFQNRFNQTLALKHGYLHMEYIPAYFPKCVTEALKMRSHTLKIYLYTLSYTAEVLATRLSVVWGHLNNTASPA